MRMIVVKSDLASQGTLDYCPWKGASRANHIKHIVDRVRLNHRPTASASLIISLAILANMLPRVLVPVFLHIWTFRLKQKAAICSWFVTRLIWGWMYIHHSSIPAYVDGKKLCACLLWSLRTTFDGEGDVSGNFALDGRNGRVRLAATDKSGTRVTLALDVGKAVAVKIQQPGWKGSWDVKGQPHIWLFESRVPSKDPKFRLFVI